MKIYSTRELAANAVTSQPNRPTTNVIHDVPDARIVLFRIDPGQQVPVHKNRSTVLLMIVSGSGTVVGGAEEQVVHPGDIVAYDVEELHGMRAGEEQLVIAAVIAPRPGR